MALRRPGGKPVSDTMMVYFTDAYALLGLNDLISHVAYLISHKATPMKL